MMVKILVFGNEDEISDSKAPEVAEKLKDFEGVEFVQIKPNEDLPLTGDLVLMDTVMGIDKIMVIKDENVEKLVMPKRGSVHDFDLSIQLKYLKKIGKLNKVTIIGLPMNGETNYVQLQSILRKLVAQDIQGS